MLATSGKTNTTVEHELECLLPTHSDIQGYADGCYRPIEDEATRFIPVVQTICLRSYKSIREISMPSSLLFGSAASVLMLLSSLANASNTAPHSLVCKRVANVGCSENGICIADKMIDPFPITFNFAAKRFQSAVGTGRIHQSWELADGRHGITAISPPASAEFIFSKDWRNANSQISSGVRYTCTDKKWRKGRH
jgi:hypothetical protein